MLLLIGPESDDICRCDSGGQHERLLTARGWQSLAELDQKQIRALAPDGLKLPPNAKVETLAEAVTAAVFAGGTLSSAGWKVAPNGPPGIRPATVEPNPEPEPDSEEESEEPGEPAGDPEEVDPLRCPDCGRDDFATEAGRRGHQTRMHG